MIRFQQPLEIEPFGRVRFERIDDRLLRARVQATFDALYKAGMVAFKSDVLAPGVYRAIELRGPGPYAYTAMIAPQQNGAPEMFWVRRDGDKLPPNGQLAGPFSTLPFTPAPATSGTPLPAMIFVDELKPRDPLGLPPPKTHELPPMQLPPGVPAIPVTLGASAGRKAPMAAVLGFFRGFAPAAGGAQLAAA